MKIFYIFTNLCKCEIKYCDKHSALNILRISRVAWIFFLPRNAWRSRENERGNMKIKKKLKINDNQRKLTKAGFETSENCDLRTRCRIFSSRNKFKKIQRKKGTASKEYR